LDPKKIAEALAPWQVLIAAIIAIAPGIFGIWEAALQWNPLAWSWREIAYASVATTFVVFVTFRSRREQASRLLDADALRLDPQSPEHLIGRRDDLNKLLNALANPLVFLVSESGCGKSALLRAGVVPGQAFTERFLPVYIDMSVLDWEDGPRRAVREGFSRLLSADDPLRSKLGSHSMPEDFSEVFNDYLKRSQRRALLLLDQFDDYQAQPQHRERFLPKDTRVWRTADQIEKENAFWRVLHSCLQNDSMSVVVACREDAAKGLESIRFYREVPQFDLARLEPGLVRMIIDRLTNRSPDKPVIENPEGGWTDLRDRLADDLEARGPLLPQQLKLVLGGLRTLRRLTPAAYARIGRLAGLEAAFVAGALTKAARVAGLSDDSAILRMLTSLVDRDRQPPDKTPPKATGELAAVAALPEDIAAAALKQLEGDEVLRKRGDSEKEATVWQLDHAYLAQPVLRIERERDQWRHLLAERARAYADASWRSKWSALLPVVTQIQLLVARMKGRFRYAGYRTYALKSATRSLPAIAVLALLAALAWAAKEYDAAANIVQSLAGSQYKLTDYSAAGLAQLTSRGWITRWRVENETFNSRQPAEWFAANPQPILRALVRLDPDRFDALVRTNVTAQALSQPDRPLRAAAGELAKASSPAALSDSTRKAFESVVLETIQSPSNTADFEAAGTAIETSIAALPDGSQDASRWLVALREAIGTKHDFYQISWLAHDYAAAATKMVGTDSHAPQVLAAMRAANSEFQLYPHPFGEAYTAIIGKMSSADPQITGELAALRSATTHPHGNDGFSFLATAYAAVIAKVRSTDPRLTDELAMLRNSMTKSTDPDALSALATMYASAVARIDDADSRAGEELVALGNIIMQSGVDTRRIALAKAYAAVVAKLGIGDPHASEILNTLPEAIRKATDTDQLATLAQAYVALKTRVAGTSSHVPEVLGALRSTIVKTGNSVLLEVLGRTYASLAATLGDAGPVVSQEIIQIRDALGRTDNGNQVEALMLGYAALAAKLEDADERIPEALAAIQEKLGADSSAPLRWECYTTVIAKRKMAESDILDALRSIRDRMQRVFMTGDAKSLANSYVAVAAKLGNSDSHIAAELADLRSLATDTPFLVQFNAYAYEHAYVSILSRLKDGDYRVRNELTALRDAMDLRESLNLSLSLSILASEYEAAAAKLIDGDSRATAELLALSDAISKTADPDKLQALALAYAAAAKRARLVDAPRRDIAILLARTADLRTAAQSKAFASALREAVRLGQTPLSVDQIGLVYAAALLQPVSGGEPSGKLVSDFEEILRQRVPGKLKESWSGDVWAFVKWARENLPGFDMHSSNIGFLPAVNLPTGQ
jgi:hypothetical protein